MTLFPEEKAQGRRGVLSDSEAFSFGEMCETALE
jgi:hypothetical protein